MENLATAIPAGETAGRIRRLQAELRKAGLNAFLATRNVDLLYLTGSMQSGYAWIPAEGEATFYVRRSVERAAGESHVRTVPLGSFRSFGETVARDYPGLARASGSAPLHIAAALEAMPAQLYLKLAELFASQLNGASIVDGSAVIRRIRAVKSPWEIGRIEAAAAVAAEALEAALPALREGVTELEWMARFEHEIRIRGHIGVMRMRGYNQEVLTGMVGSGAAAAEPASFDGPAGGRGLGPAAAQSVSRKPFRRGEPILIDVGCCIDGYVIDQTRTAVIGRLPDELAAAYAASESILRRAEAALVPGASPEAVYTEALAAAGEAGLAAHFMGFGEDRVKFLGHGIGLEVDEWPVLASGFREPLAEGMVIAIEPKFTFPGRGVVGIENTYAVAAAGARRLTRSPEDIIQLP